MSSRAEFGEVTNVKRRTVQVVARLLLAALALLLLASGQHGSYFCVSPWAGDGPTQPAAEHANP
jgi:hypothetical protein